MKITIKSKDQRVLNYIIQDRNTNFTVKVKVINNIIIECNHNVWVNETFDNKLENLIRSNKYNITTI